MNKYLVTVWDRSWKYQKYSYLVGLSDPKDYCKTLRQNYDRFTIEYKGDKL